MRSSTPRFGAAFRWAGLACAFVLALTAAGCSNTCSYGTGSDGVGGDCGDRPKPTAGEAKGHLAKSMTGRLATARAKVGPEPVISVIVNYWGELGIRRGDDVVYASRFNGEPVKHEDELNFTGGTRPFSLRRVDPAALERAMRAITAREPTASFLEAHAKRWFPRVPGSDEYPLHWVVGVQVGKRNDHYEADPRGRLQCIQNTAAGDGSCRPLR